MERLLETVVAGRLGGGRRLERERLGELLLRRLLLCWTRHVLVVRFGGGGVLGVLGFGGFAVEVCGVAGLVACCLCAVGSSVRVCFVVRFI